MEKVAEDIVELILKSIMKTFDTRKLNEILKDIDISGPKCAKIYYLRSKYRESNYN